MIFRDYRDTEEYQQGWKAYFNNLRLSNNPYNTNTLEYKDWEYGFFDAEAEDPDHR